MRNNLYTGLAAITLAAATYLVYSHWQWMQDYQSTAGAETGQEVMPLVINTLLLLPGILMLLVLVKKIVISNLLLYGSLICVALLVASIYTTLQPGEAAGGGLLMIMGTYPSAIVLAILATQTLAEGKNKA